jgi:hypothetical protein
MPLFIDRLPFHRWTDYTRTLPQDHWCVVLPVFVTDTNLATPPAGITQQEWVLDIGNRHEGFAWRHHLLVAGLDPDANQIPARMRMKSALGQQLTVPLREVDLWLLSNLPALQGAPFRLPLADGLPFRDVPQLPDPEFHRPLIGMRALRRAGLRVELDFAQDTISVWTPDLPGQQP